MEKHQQRNIGMHEKGQLGLDCKIVDGDCGTVALPLFLLTAATTRLTACWKLGGPLVGPIGKVSHRY